MSRVGNDLFRLLVRHAPVCIHEIGLDGRLTAMNPAGLAMMGVVEEAAVCGMPYLDAVGDHDRPRIAALMEEALHGGAAHFEFQSAGDEPRDFSSNFIPMHDDDGAFCGLMGVTQDVTEQRRAERSLVALNASLESEVAARTAALEHANRRLTAQNQELTEFARVVSHDLRSPLTAILGLASLLEESSPRPDQAGELALIVESSVRMAAMIEELLQLARIGDSVEVDEGGVALDEVLQDVCEGLSHQIATTAATVTHGALPRVRGTATEHRRVLQNLIDNALKFRAERAPMVHVSADRVPQGWQISVRDNGVGFPAAEQEAIFRVFYRATVDATRPGTGVGLSICKKLVEARGGKLHARSVPGEGSTFSYTVAAP